MVYSRSGIVQGTKSNAFRAVTEDTSSGNCNEILKWEEEDLLKWFDALRHCTSSQQLLSLVEHQRHRVENTLKGILTGNLRAYFSPASETVLEKSFGNGLSSSSSSARSP
jgi:hypothetical protein